MLFVYDVGGIEAARQHSTGFDEHIRWLLQYHDQCFQTHHSIPFIVVSIRQKHQAL